jgi:hydroxymethylpyrimidine/phosphomethylpyrimidine kinase
MGCHPLSVITAITVQDTHGVEGAYPLDPDWVAEQARVVLGDIPVAAFKVGVLGSPEITSVIAEIVAEYPGIPLVLDPVLASGRGDDLASDDVLSALREILLPQATVVTPNIMELARLSQNAELDEDESDAAVLAARLIAMGCEYVLATGTHDRTADVTNRLFGETGLLRSDTWPRLAASYHGSGCTLASALAAGLARGLEVDDAVLEAQEFTYQSLQAAFRPGMGQLIPDRFFWAREAEEAGADAGA